MTFGVFVIPAAAFDVHLGESLPVLSFRRGPESSSVAVIPAKAGIQLHGRHSGESRNPF
jgi:hypothetical protein